MVGFLTSCRWRGSSLAASRCVRHRWSPDGSCYRRRWTNAGTPRRDSAWRLAMTHTSRRELAMLATAALIARTALAQTNEAPSIIRAIPRTGERIPAVGLGTAYGFDRNDEQTRRAA